MRRRTVLAKGRMWDLVRWNICPYCIGNVALHGSPQGYTHGPVDLQVDAELARSILADEHDEWMLRDLSDNAVLLQFSHLLSMGVWHIHEHRPTQQAQARSGLASGNRSIKDALRRDSTYSDPSSFRNREPSEDWIEIELLGEDDLPIPSERFEIRLPDGQLVSGRLDRHGLARITGIETTGTCYISFPDLDRDAWTPHPSGVLDAKYIKD